MGSLSAINQLVENNIAYARSFKSGGLSPVPRRRVAVLTCMDARVDPARALGLVEGDAHVIRNAGGIATDDTVRSLVISQRVLQSQEIMLVHHTDCGMETADEDAIVEQIEAAAGFRPSFELHTFRDVEASLRDTAQRLRAEPLLNTRLLRAFIYDVATGHLHEQR